MHKFTTAVVIPNWNGRATLAACLDSLLAQTEPADIVVVDNGSVDGSVNFIKVTYPSVILIEEPKNRGFAGGVNSGIRHAMDHGCQFVALLNNDAVADKDWLRQLSEVMVATDRVGIVTGKLLSMDKLHLDSTGECFSHWGLAFPRGRGELDSGQYDQATTVFGATGGASLYSAAMFKQIGLFDEAFFAYYEDVDLSWRAQLAGWQVRYEPTAVAYHHIGATSGQLKGFTTYHTLKNLPMVVHKNLPARLLPRVLPRFWLAYTAFFWRTVARGHPWIALKGFGMAVILLPKNIWQRSGIQKHRKVSIDYVRGLLFYDLPPAAAKLRRLRAIWRR